MTFHPTIARGAALVVLLAGCQSQNTDVAVDTSVIAPTDSIASPRSEIVAFHVPPASAGHLQHVGMRLKYIDCTSTGEALSIEDNATDEAITLLNDVDKGGNGINVVLRIKDGRVEQIRYAATEGVGCDRLPPEGDLDAKGNEPFWSLRIDGDSATVRTPSESAGATYRGGQWSQTDAQDWRYVAQRTDADSITVTLVESRCTDSMSGARYPFQATLTRGGNTFKGCALEGKRSFRP